MRLMCRVTLSLLLVGAWVPSSVVLAGPDTAPAATQAAPALAKGPVAFDRPSPKMDHGQVSANFLKRHELLVRRAKAGDVDVYFEGDSITQGWEGKGKKVWDRYLAPLHAGNFGIGGDRTEHVLWRLANGELENVHPKAVVIMIGTNNLGTKVPDADRKIADGITAIVNTFREKTPDAKILLLGIFPRQADPLNPVRARIKNINAMISGLDDGQHVTYLDIGQSFLEPDGTLSKNVMPDYLHPNARGYQIEIDAMLPTLYKLLGKDPGEIPAPLAEATATAPAATEPTTQAAK